MEVPDELKEKIEKIFSNHSDYFEKILSDENKMQIFSKNVEYTNIEEFKEGLLALDSTAIIIIGHASQIGFKPEEIVNDYGKDKMDLLFEDAKTRVELRQLYNELIHIQNLGELGKLH